MQIDDKNEENIYRSETRRFEMGNCLWNSDGTKQLF